LISPCPFRTIFSYEDFCKDPVSKRKEVYSFFNIIPGDSLDYSKEKLVIDRGIIKEDKKCFEREIVTTESCFRCQRTPYADIIYSGIRNLEYNRSQNS
jgi:hypothetical protein